MTHLKCPLLPAPGQTTFNVHIFPSSNGRNIVLNVSLLVESHRPLPSPKPPTPIGQPSRNTIQLIRDGEKVEIIRMENPLCISSLRFARCTLCKDLHQKAKKKKKVAFFPGASRYTPYLKKGRGAWFWIISIFRNKYLATLWSTENFPARFARFTVVPLRMAHLNVVGLLAGRGTFETRIETDVSMPGRLNFI